MSDHRKIANARLVRYGVGQLASVWRLYETQKLPPSIERRMVITSAFAVLRGAYGTHSNWRMLFTALWDQLRHRSSLRWYAIIHWREIRRDEAEAAK